MFGAEKQLSVESSSPTKQLPGTTLFGLPAEEVPALREYLRDSNWHSWNQLTDLAPDATIILLPNSRIVDCAGCFRRA